MNLPSSRRPVWLAVVLSVLLLPLATAPAAPPAAPDGPAVETTLRAFYHWYVHLLNVNERVDPLTQHRAEMRQYVTEHRLHALERAEKGPDGLDGDYFLDAQDWGHDWEKNIVVNHIRLGPVGHATAEVALSDPNFKGARGLRVGLLAVDGHWKIDEVKGIDP